MGQSETSVFKKLQIRISPIGYRLFRNLVGGAWMGRVTEEYMIRDEKKDRSMKVIELADAYHVKTGLGTGSSDAVGWRPLVITKDMVGKTIAQFLAAEIKTLSYKKITEEQLNFLHQVVDSGGLAWIVKEREDGEIEIQVVEKK